MGGLAPGPFTQGPISNLIFLEWVVPSDGYRIEARPANPEMGARSGLYLSPTDSRLSVYRPMEQHPAMFREFADVEQTLAGVVTFANKYGAPFGDPDRTYSDLPLTAVPSVRLDLMHFGNEIEFIYGCIRDMQHAVTQYETGGLSEMIESSSKVARSSLKILPVQGRKTPDLIIQPDSLMDAMWFQFALVVAGGIQIRKCSQCPAWFPFGTGTGRRKSALYCTDRCRKAAHEKRRRPRK